MSQSRSDFTSGILQRQRDICAIKLVSCLPFKCASLTCQIKLDAFSRNSHQTEINWRITELHVMHIDCRKFRINSQLSAQTQQKDIKSLLRLKDSFCYLKTPY